MGDNTYLMLFGIVTPLIEKQDTTLREAIPAHERLSITLGFFATGKSYKDKIFHHYIASVLSRQIVSVEYEQFELSSVMQKMYVKQIVFSTISKINSQ